MLTVIFKWVAATRENDSRTNLLGDRAKVNVLLELTLRWIWTEKDVSHYHYTQDVLCIHLCVRAYVWMLFSKMGSESGYYHLLCGEWYHPCCELLICPPNDMTTTGNHFLTWSCFLRENEKLCVLCHWWLRVAMSVKLHIYHRTWYPNERAYIR